MGLSAYEQQELDFIEEAIAGSDPRLASLLGTFARLMAEDELPVREQIRAADRRIARRPGTRRWRPPPPGTSLRARRGHRGLQPAWPLPGLSVSIALIAVALVLSHSQGGGACTVRVITCTEQAPAHAVGPAAPTAQAGWALSTSG